MDRPGHQDTDFFIGTEVEHSPALGKRTLFVVGVQPTERILPTAYNNDCEHIYFGANHSFPGLMPNDVDSWNPWEQMIKECLDNDYWCTLDLDVGCAAGLLESGLVEHRRFIPMISVKLPYTELFNYNTTIKIDDRDFDSTNAGVWCHSLQDLMDRQVFTSWDAYSKDEVIL